MRRLSRWMGHLERALIHLLCRRCEVRKKRKREGDTRIVELKEEDGTLYYLAERLEWLDFTEGCHLEWQLLYKTKSGTIADTQRKLADLLQAAANREYRKVVG